LHYAVFGGNKEVVALLIAKGAKLDARAPNGQTALMIAAKLRSPELVQQLVDADADMDLADYDGLTALRLAHQAGNAEIVDYLRKVGAVE
jgi:ankyrin repeat protein